MLLSSSLASVFASSLNLFTGEVSDLTHASGMDLRHSSAWKEARIDQWINSNYGGTVLAVGQLSRRGLLPFQQQSH